MKSKEIYYNVKFNGNKNTIHCLFNKDDIRIGYKTYLNFISSFAPDVTGMNLRDYVKQYIHSSVSEYLISDVDDLVLHSKPGGIMI
jgi:hypothetical protein